MGFRYRKSINLGGGFKINLSKSGLGYSWGVKGFRLTKTAKGTTRTTASIPGTGLAYISETGKKSKDKAKQSATSSAKQSSQTVDDHYFDAQSFENNTANTIVSAGLEDMLTAANKSVKLNILANIGILFFVGYGTYYPIFYIAAILFLGMKIFVRTQGVIDLDYSIDEDQQAAVAERMDSMINITRCEKVWRIIQAGKVSDANYAAGAEANIKRKKCKVSTKAPFPFKTNMEIASFKLGREKLLFFPDKLFIIQGRKIGALNYADINIMEQTTRFVESEKVPKDAKIVDQTWSHVTKSGEPDRRFKNNQQFPVCLYGMIGLQSDQGLNTIIMFSNPDIVS